MAINALFAAPKGAARLMLRRENQMAKGMDRKKETKKPKKKK